MRTKTKATDPNAPIVIRRPPGAPPSVHEYWGHFSDIGETRLIMRLQTRSREALRSGRTKLDAELEDDLEGVLAWLFLMWLRTCVVPRRDRRHAKPKRASRRGIVQGPKR